jgi:L-aspartate oxidase
MATGNRVDADVTVVGAGAAGLYTALTAAREGATVALISATPLDRSASYWAQGGLAAALAQEDSPAQHLEDTVKAGRGAVRRSAARVLTEEAGSIVEDLQRLGVHFDADRHGALALGLEGGHSVRRVVHAGGSATGRRITRDLSALVAQDPKIAVHEGRRAIRLLTAEERCAGVVCHDGLLVTSPAVVLATGGAAALYARTTNPKGAVGTGLMLAEAAGATLADLELIQFHPTAVVSPDPDVDGFLVTEAIRGEGATLLDTAGNRFVDELAPRDEVALAVENEIRKSARSSVDLDMRQVEPTHFPNVVAALRRAGIEPTRDLVPVAPAAHYVMGGIATDLDGRSSLPSLYAVGECSCTGLHGANRLASNSLTECFVFGRRAARHALDEPKLRGLEPNSEQSGGDVPVRPTEETRQALWRDAGLERTPEGLMRLHDDPHPLARVIAACALARTESRGAHRRVDAPTTDPAFDELHAVLRDRGEPAFERWF